MAPIRKQIISPRFSLRAILATHALFSLRANLIFAASGFSYFAASGFGNIAASGIQIIAASEKRHDMSTTIETTEPPKRGRGRPPKGERALSSTERSKATRTRKAHDQFRVAYLATDLLDRISTANPSLANYLITSEEGRKSIENLRAFLESAGYNILLPEIETALARVAAAMETRDQDEKVQETAAEG